jgi:hypothetical protein
MPWYPMPENTHFYHISLREGFALKLKLMQASVIRKTVRIHRELKGTFDFLFSYHARPTYQVSPSFFVRALQKQMGFPSDRYAIGIWCSLLTSAYRMPDDPLTIIIFSFA